MKNMKAITATALTFGLLAATDICLYALRSRLFLILTGAVAGFGLIRGAMDFYNWLRVPEDDAIKLVDNPLDGALDEGEDT